MEKLANFCFGMATSTKLLARLKAGFFVREILEHFTMKKELTLSPDRSLWIYSAHDATIANVLNTLGLFEVTIVKIFNLSLLFSLFSLFFLLQPHIPIYASCLLFELHKYNGTYHVEIFYKRYREESTERLEPLSIPNCGKKCPLSKMYEIYKDIIPTEDFNSECRITTKPEGTSGGSIKSK